MSEPVRIELFPLGRTLRVAPGTPLQGVLFEQGVEFPCGGRGRCQGCRVKLLAGELPVTVEDAHCFSAAEQAAGWRLSCQAVARADLRLEVGQWDAAILADDRDLKFEPRAGLGIAVDLGTTTVVGQLVDLARGQVIGVWSALNAQAQHGADVMSRVDFAVHQGGTATLQRLVREQVGRLVAELLRHAGRSADELHEVILVGNTVMHHLFAGVDLAPMAQHPFDPADPSVQTLAASALGWPGPRASVRFLPCLGGFVGSDLLAGILATRLHAADRPAALIDLGTNGEILVGNRDRILCASTAAGPAFEGARISMGMRAATGAISEVAWRENRLECRVLGDAAPRGLCGSGLVDAVAVALDRGWINPRGGLASPALELTPPVVLRQRDVRELQLAKGAIAAGLRLLTERWGTSVGELEAIHLAGAFGNYINRASARRIGLLPVAAERVWPAGNTALLGAKLALFRPPDDDGGYVALRRRVEHVALNEDPEFQDRYVTEMSFPEPG